MTLRARRVLDVLPAVALACAVLPMLALVVAAWVGGFQLRPLLTSSMEPAYARGSLLVVAPLGGSRPDVGQTIVFSDPASPGRLVAHRVIGRIGNTDATPSYRTKGDANLAADTTPVAISDVRGEVRWSVPGLGRPVAMASSLRSPWVLPAVPAALLVLSETLARARARRRRTGTTRECAVCGALATP